MHYSCITVLAKASTGGANPAKRVFRDKIEWKPCSRALQKYGKLTYDEGKDTILLVPPPEEEEEVEEEDDGSWDEPVPA